MSGPEEAPPAVENRVAEHREKRGLAVASLARSCGVPRQTIYAIEAGTFVPNTAVALRLARALETRVEDLFHLDGESESPERRMQMVDFVPGAGVVRAGQTVQLCQVDKRTLASVASPTPWYLPASDAVVESAGVGGRAKVQVLDAHEKFASRLLIAGCDPGISVLARHAQAAGVELVMAHRNSTQALDLLKQGSVHIAGTHLTDEKSGESNLADIRRRFPGSSVAVVTFATWEEGLVFARGNPKRIRGVADLAREDVSIVNREKGAGSRRLLEAHLKRLDIAPREVCGFDRIAGGHLAVAWRVHSGDADCCIATRAAARVFGLDFAGLVSERYDLVIRRSHLKLPAVQTLFDVLSRSRFRRQLEGFGGYETRDAGMRVV